MAINFNVDSVFNLRPLDVEKVRKDVKGLLVEGETIVAAFHTVRDQLVFTDKRIIAIDVQGFTGVKKTFTTLPYSKVQYFTVETPGFMELIPDSILHLIFADGTTMHFEMKGSVDIGQLCRVISRYVLG